jgi:V8-like Glu-specific endopeptidase
VSKTNATARHELPHPTTESAARAVEEKSSDKLFDINPADPFRFTQIKITANESYAASGVLIGPDIVLTVGHAIHRTAFSGYASTVVVESPYATIPADCQPTRWRVPDEWRVNGNESHDLGLLRLGNLLPLPFRLMTPTHIAAAELQANPFRIYGYLSEERSKLHYSVGAASDVSDGRIFHSAETYEGQSGGALVCRIGGKWKFAGLHRAGVRLGNNPSPPNAIHLDASALAWISAAILLVKDQSK